MSNLKATVCLPEMRFDYDSQSAKLFAENVPGIMICLRAKTQSKGCRLCLARGGNLQIRHLFSLAYPLLRHNDIK